MKTASLLISVCAVTASCSIIKDKPRVATFVTSLDQVCVASYLKMSTFEGASNYLNCPKSDLERVMPELVRSFDDENRYTIVKSFSLGVEKFEALQTEKKELFIKEAAKKIVRHLQHIEGMNERGLQVRETIQKNNARIYLYQDAFKRVWETVLVKMWMSYFGSRSAYKLPQVGPFKQTFDNEEVLHIIEHFRILLEERVSTQFKDKELQELEDVRFVGIHVPFMKPLLESAFIEVKHGQYSDWDKNPEVRDWDLIGSMVFFLYGQVPTPDEQLQPKSNVIEAVKLRLQEYDSYLKEAGDAIPVDEFKEFVKAKNGPGAAVKLGFEVISEYKEEFLYKLAQLIQGDPLQH